MKILAVETSCDETAIALLEVTGGKGKTKFKILGNEVSSQIALHTQYGGVFPAMAKREHGKNILGVLENVLREAKLYKPLKVPTKIATKDKNKIDKILNREDVLRENFIGELTKIKNPGIDAIAVTTGPGLEPALWVGISFAKALSTYWGVPFVPVNHMEGHIFSIFPTDKKTFTIDTSKNILPMLSLLVSGGHTELVLVKDWSTSKNGKITYKKLGRTRDDASGEAFDKVARMLELPYPGGPEISKMAAIERAGIERENVVPGSLTQADGPSTSKKSSKILLCADGNNISNEIPEIVLPRPMIYTKDYDFSFSGLKTAVLYLIRDLKEKNPKIFDDIKIKQRIACEFENAVIETLVYKTIKAIKEYKIKTLIVGGGVSANRYLQEVMANEVKKLKLSSSTTKNKIKVLFPSKRLTGDNALMIGIAGFFQFKNKKIVKNLNSVKANGNLSL